MNKQDKKSQKELITELTENLEKTIQQFMESEKYKAFLTQMAQFHSYSLNNQILIALQKPDATLCASYAGWKKNERHVKPGEKGIKIICPAPYKTQTIKNKVNPQTGEIEYSTDGSPKKKVVEKVIPAYKIGYTFDISQTEGKDLPEITQRLQGDLDTYQKNLLQALQKISPVPVLFQPIQGDANGYYHKVEKTIVVDDNLSEKQTLKTLVHELSHALLHNTDVPDVPKDSSIKEVQAESIAYIVCQYFGIDSSEYSFGYIAGWSSDKEVSELKNSLEIIRTTSNKIITEAEFALTQKEIPVQATKNTINKTISKRRCI